MNRDSIRYRQGQVPGLLLQPGTGTEPQGLEPLAGPVEIALAASGPAMIDVLGHGMESCPGRMTDARDVLADAFVEQAEQLGTDVLGTCACCRQPGRDTGC